MILSIITLVLKSCHRSWLMKLQSKTVMCLSKNAAAASFLCLLVTGDDALTTPLRQLVINYHKLPHVCGCEDAASVLVIDSSACKYLKLLFFYFTTLIDTKQKQLEICHLWILGSEQILFSKVFNLRGNQSYNNENIRTTEMANNYQPISLGTRTKLHHV